MMKQLRMLLVLMLCLLPGLALAADDNTTIRFPDAFTDGKFLPENQVSTFALSRDETIGDALKDGDFSLADKSRLNYQVPKGLKVTSQSVENGRITLTIDLKNSDWGELLLSANPYPYVSVRHSLDRPTDTAYSFETHVGFSGGFDHHTVSYVLDLMEEMIRWDSNNTQSGNGEFVAEIVPSQSLAQPGRSTTSMNLICWLDKDHPEVRHYEYYEVVVKIVDTSAFHIPFRYVTEDTLKASEKVSLPAGVSIKEIVNGSITYRISNSFTQSQDVTVALNAPASASYMVVTQPEHYANEMHQVSNGVATFTRQIHPESNEDEQFTIAWYNSADKLVDYGIFMFRKEPFSYAAWPAYESNWHAVPSNRLRLENNAAGAGVTFTYTDYASNGDDIGDLHIGYNPDAEITGNIGVCIAWVKAPANANYYRINHSGGNNIMGKDSYLANDQIIFTSAQDLIPIERDENGDAWIEIMAYEPVRTIHAGPLEVYMQIGEGNVWPYAGGIFSIFWYTTEEQAALNDGKSPELIEYVSDTMGDLCITNRVPVVEKEEDIKEPVKDVTCVGSDAYAKGWRLVIRRYPHKGSDAFHYELTLENEYGAYQPLTQPMIFYMPYPNDFNSHSGYTYGLRHYDNEYDKYELVDVSLTDYGVRFVINSLSPFVLEWEDPNNPRPEQPEHPEQPDQPGSGGNGGNNSGDSNRRYHLRHLHLQPGYDVELYNVHVQSISGCNQGTAILGQCQIEGMNVLVADYQESGKGIALTDTTTIDQLIIEVHPKMTVDRLPTEPFIFLDNSTITEIRLFDKTYLGYILQWIECSNTDVKIIQIDGEDAPIDFPAFYDAYFDQQQGGN